jgi:hypothetical protein
VRGRLRLAQPARTRTPAQRRAVRVRHLNVLVAVDLPVDVVVVLEQ